MINNEKILRMIMMTYTISLKLEPATYQQFLNIHQKLNASDREPQAKILGENLSKIACEVIHQAFGQLVKNGSSKDQDSAKVLTQIQDAIMKYMPWSVSFFGNDRLLPMVNHVRTLIYEQNGQHYISYPVEKSLIHDLLDSAEQMRQGNKQFVSSGLKSFTKVVDQGVTTLIREPKKLLKFNLVVDKTLNGVISLTTQLGYKRFENLSKNHDPESIVAYFDHFMVFLDSEGQKKAKL